MILWLSQEQINAIANLFTKGSHHRNLSVIYIVQNIFHQGRETRNISLNAHYIVLFKSPRDKQQISVLAWEINPGHVQEFMKSYEEATKRPHGYLMIDLKPTTDDQHRLKNETYCQTKIPMVNKTYTVIFESDRINNNHPSPMTNIDWNRNVLPEENTYGQQNLYRYIQKRSYQQPPILNAMYNSDQQMKQIVQTPFLTLDEKNILYSNELQRFQSFQNQLQNQLHFQNNLQTQFQSFLTAGTKSLAEAKQDSTREPSDQPMQNLVVASNKQSPLNPPGIPATPKAYFLTPPPTVEHPERHWHTGDTDVDESDSGESEREHPDDIELEGTDLSKTEMEKPEDTDVNESDSGNKDPIWRRRRESLHNNHSQEWPSKSI